MITLKNTLLHNWHFMRVLKLLLGIALCYQGIQMSDWFSGLIGLLFAYQGVANAGCCGSGGCAPPVQNIRDSGSAKEIQYEEIKTNKQ